MNTSKQLAKHLREVYFGGNWTCSNVRDTLSDVSWQQAITQVHGFNTIATLLYHTYYFVHVARNVLQGKQLSGNDKYSFDHPSIVNSHDWENFKKHVYSTAHSFARLIEKVPEDKWFENFTDKKYGNYYRNIQGITEHLHYHLGQITLIKKIVQHNDKP